MDFKESKVTLINKSEDVEGFDRPHRKRNYYIKEYLGRLSSIYNNISLLRIIQRFIKTILLFTGKQDYLKSSDILFEKRTSLICKCVLKT